ncbi:MAG: PTS sugar transporter subunit IIB [Deltaproteobacteria bacterium]|nr:PTS sugar transporter subunit IIB [Deltaproteobacteria bacterium]
MSVLLARVDNRLVHGQVLEAWVPYLEADLIVVVGGEESRDPFRRSLFQALSTPQVKVEVVAPEEAPTLVEREQAHRILLLFPDVDAAWKAFRAGLRFERLNLGNVHPREGGHRVTRTVYLTTEDEEELRDLRAHGVRLEARALPTDASPHPDAFLGPGGSDR